MQKSKNLEEICRLLFRMKPDWDRIIDRFDSYPDSKKALTPTEYAKYFSEIHLDICIEDIARQHPEYKISLRAVEEQKRKRRREEERRKHQKNKDRTGSYRLDDYLIQYDKAGRVKILSKKEGTEHEYDKIIKVGDLPVVFEIKITKWSRSTKHKSIRMIGNKRIVHYREGMGIKNSLRPKVYEKRLEPVRQFFGKDVGYVVVIPQNTHYSRERHPEKGSTYDNFKEADGLIVPFYTDRKDFREKVLEKVKHYKLKLKEAS